MKRIVVIMFSVALFLTSLIMLSSPLSAQWIERGEYKEFKPSTNGISKLMLPEGESWFAVMDRNSKYYRYDYDGNLLISKQVYVDPHQNYYNQLGLTSDSKCYYLANEDYLGHGYDWDYQIRFTLYDILTDSLVFTKSFASYVCSGSGSGGGSYLTYCFDYNLRENKGFLSFIFQYGDPGQMLAR